MAAQARPANSEVTKFVERIESINHQLDTMKGEYVAECKGVREDIKNALDSAKAEGFPKAAVKAVVKARALERKARTARQDLDMVDRDTFDQIRHALGDLSTTELGEAAIRKIEAVA